MTVACYLFAMLSLYLAYRRRALKPASSSLETQCQHLFTEFKETLLKYSDDPWSRQEVINAADACMRAAYDLSISTLKDYIKNKKNLEAQDSNLRKCGNIYLVWIKRQVSWPDKRKAVVFRKREEVSPEYAAKFYEENTKQNEWRQLHNDYCQQFRQYFDQESLDKADPLFIEQTQADEFGF